jgi:hypothetical protein
LAAAYLKISSTKASVTSTRAFEGEIAVSFGKNRQAIAKAVVVLADARLMCERLPTGSSRPGVGKLVKRGKLP